MDIGTYMKFCLMHPEYGYYTNRDPLGKAGDFITAPEISQLFGEIIAVWAIQCWLKLGAPAKWSMIECGPGRGTLMHDLLRAAKVAPAFLDGMSLFLLEGSPVLIEAQKRKLNRYGPQWISSLSDLSHEFTDGPVLIIGNEFLDVLPIRQFQKTPEGWKERAVLFEEEKLVLGLKESSMPKNTLLCKAGHNAQLYDIFEYSEEVLIFWKGVLELIRERNGAALFVDYGYTRQGFGDTFQAVHQHQYSSVLSHQGSSDLTAHVNFASLAEEAKKAGCEVMGPVTQNDFLTEMGIFLRAEKLKVNASVQEKEEIDLALDRLTGEKEMGTLFKVIGVESCS